MRQALELPLPYSGKTATLRRPTGKDVIEAELLLSEGGKAASYQVAILSRVATVDGKTLPFEDFLELDMEDIDFLGKQDIKKESPPACSSQSQS